MTPEDEKKLKHDWYVNDKKENPEVYKQRAKEQYKKNKEELSKPIPCDCGETYTKLKKKRHESTAYHIKVMAMTPEERTIFFNTPKETEVERKARWFKEKMKDLTVCECGEEISKIYLKRHKESKKHLRWITAQTETKSPE
jgi:hypothetical protein